MVGEIFILLFVAAILLSWVSEFNIDVVVE
jgi:hypothetical protein